jgi:hypothetical protein
VAFGFEAGQHDSLSAIRIQEAFVRLSLVFAGCLDPKHGDVAFDTLVRSSGDTLNFYEIFFRYQISEGEQFRMEPGFVNFQSIRKGQKLAMSNGQDIEATRDAKLFMPLYQSQGEDGFFVIRKVPRFFLNLSETVRKLKVDRVLPLLPGVSWANRTRQSLKVDRRVARFFTKQAFHLLGYRSKAIDRDGYIMKNREAGSRTQEYRHTPWWRQ